MISKAMTEEKSKNVIPTAWNREVDSGALELIRTEE